MSADQLPAGEAPALRFPAGTSAEDVATVVALLAAAGGPEEAPAPGTPRQWGHPARAVRRSAPAGRGGWWISQLP